MEVPIEIADTPTHHHIVQFFDDGESLAAGVATFAYEGVRAGDSVLIVAKSTTRHRLLEMLDRLGVDAEERARRLVLLDAHTILARFSRYGIPDPQLFETVVAPAVERLGARRRVYGEMVDILAEEGNFAGVHQLESLWGSLGERLPFTLLCGYASAHFAAPTASGMMRRICQLHHRVERREHDLLANWLLETQGAT